MNMAPERRAESTRHAVDCRCGRTAPRCYGGAVGYFTAHGDLGHLWLLSARAGENGIATVQAGAESCWTLFQQSEADETRNKARAVLQALSPPRIMHRRPSDG